MEVLNVPNRPAQMETTFTVPQDPFTSLFVANIPLNVPQHLLENMFACFGQLISFSYVSLRRESLVSKQATVVFATDRSAQRAMDALAFTKLEDRLLSISRYDRTQVGRNAAENKVVAKNLPLTLDDREVYLLFRSIGPLKATRLVRKADGSSRGFAFGQYCSEMDAYTAATTLHQSVVHDKVIEVEMCHEPQLTMEPGQTYVKLFVQPLPTTFFERDLEALFAREVTVLRCVVVRDRLNNSMGFGFVAVPDHEQARIAVERLHDFRLPGTRKRLLVRRAFDQPALPSSYSNFSSACSSFSPTLSFPEHGTNVRVENIGPSMKEPTLRLLFSRFGVLQNAQVVRFASGASKGFGFVNFESPQAAQHAIAAMDGHVRDGLRLHVFLAQRQNFAYLRAEGRDCAVHPHRIQFTGDSLVGTEVRNFRLETGPYLRSRCSRRIPERT